MLDIFFVFKNFTFKKFKILFKELILLQLVQALRYEPIEENALNSILTQFLIKRVTKDINLSTLFYWYLSVECDNKKEKDSKSLKICSWYQNILDHFLNSLNDNSTFLDIIKEQQDLKKKFKILHEKMKKFGTVEAKISELRKVAATTEWQSGFKDQNFCLDPKVFK